MLLYGRCREMPFVSQEKTLSLEKMHSACTEMNIKDLMVLATVLFRELKQQTF